MGYNGYMDEKLEETNIEQGDVSEQKDLNSEQNNDSGWDILANYERPSCVEIDDMTKVPDGYLANQFTSGVYLFHGTKVDNARAIMGSGAIMNADALYEQKIEDTRSRLKTEGKSEEEIQQALKIVNVSRNSGQEGISWSSNGIDALPGEAGHIVGFVAAPELVLGNDKLVVPSRPAPYELLQVSSDVDTKKFFETKKQYEVWGYKDVALLESASVDSGLMFLRKSNLEAKKAEGEQNSLLTKSFMDEFAKKGGLPAEELRKHFRIMEDGRVRVDEQLHQQKFDENYLPPGVVWVQAMLDKGLFDINKFDNTGLQGLNLDGMGVNEIIEKTYDIELLTLYMLNEAWKESKRYLKEYEEELDKIQPVKVPVESMYLVTNRKDLEMWMDEMERTGHYPKGVLLYDEEKVVTPNFASEKKGDHTELADEIGRVVGVDGDFWQREMGMDVKNLPRAGSHDQVLREDVVDYSVEVELVDGKLAVVKN